MKRRSPHGSAVCLLGFASGARPGELVTTKISDLELNREVGRWLIARHEGPDGHPIPGCKGRPDGRIIYLDPETTSRLREMTARRFAEEWLTPADAVFTRKSNHSYPTANSLGHLLNRAGETGIERRLTGKVFRQTHNTLSQLAGVPDALTQEQVGHSSARMTALYSRFPEKAREEAAKRVGLLVNSGDSDE